MCVPSRLSLMLGQYVHQIGAWDNGVVPGPESFLLYVGYMHPHFPLVAPSEYRELYHPSEPSASTTARR